MFKQLFHLSPDSTATLQQQVREQISKAILEGHIPADVQLPSTRELAKMLKISRNTVIIAYQDLIADGYLISKERAGFYVDPNILRTNIYEKKTKPINAEGTPDWNHFLKLRPSSRKLSENRRWQTYTYPFIYGQLDPEMFPFQHWRECCLDSVRIQSAKDWSSDHYDVDAPLLIEQIHSRILPRRGIWAEPEEILITVGAQHALYMTLNVLLNKDTVFGLEEPGYPDLNRMSELTGSETRCLDLDENGLIMDEQLDDCDLIFTTPSHQFPSTVTMPLENRKTLLDRAVEKNFLIIEDDYECETNFSSYPTPALKSLDNNERVIYIGSLSKTLSPGLRIGFIVAPKELIHEIREFRRMMLRHPPMNNQRAVGLFLERGYYDSLIRNLLQVYEERWNIMKETIGNLLPETTIPPAFGGSAYWLECDERINSHQLQKDAMENSILLETGDIYFYCNDPPMNCFRLGYSSIPTERIKPGLELLASLIEKQIKTSKDSDESLSYYKSLFKTGR